MSTQYVIHPGIASYARVENLSTGRCDAFIYLNSQVIIGDARMSWGQTPAELQVALRNHFNTVFAMPIDERCKYMETVESFYVDVP